MEDDIQKVMILANCTEEQAIKYLNEANNNIVDAVCLHMNFVSLCAPKQKTMDDTQKFFAKLRSDMDILNESITKGFISPSQSESLGQGDLPSRHEEMVQRNNYSVKCPPPSPESEAQTQEIVCLLQSEHSCDLPLKDQR